MTREKNPSCKVIWKAPLIPRCSFIAWIALRNRLPTLDRMQKWNIQLPNRCVLCKEDEENVDHIMCQCRYSIRVWQMIRELCRVEPLLNNSVASWFREASQKLLDKDLQGKKGRLCLLVGMYYIWMERNARNFSENSRSPTEVATSVCSSVMISLQQVS